MDLRDALLSALARELLVRPYSLKKSRNWRTAIISRRPTPDPWQKIFTGGSDDHGGQFRGRRLHGNAEGPDSRRISPALFARRMRAAQGEGGTPLALSHGFYNTVSCFIQDRFTERLGPTGPLLETMFSRFMEGRDPTEFTLREKADLHRSRRDVGKNLRTGEAAERFALERTLETFLPAEGQSATGQGNERA